MYGGVFKVIKTQVGLKQLALVLLMRAFVSKTDFEPFCSCKGMTPVEYLISLGLSKMSVYLSICF